MTRSSWVTHVSGVLALVGVLMFGTAASAQERGDEDAAEAAANRTATQDEDQNRSEDYRSPARRDAASRDQTRDRAADQPRDAAREDRTRERDATRAQSRTGGQEARTREVDDQRERDARREDTRREDSRRAGRAERDDDPRRLQSGRADQRQPDRQARSQQPQQNLGVEFGDQRGEQGLVVSNVERQGLAAQSGLRQGDEILSVDGRQIRDARQFESFIMQSQNRQVPVIILRDGQRYTVRLQGGGQWAARQQQEEDRAWLGVSLADEQEQDEAGARVTRVYPASPAARAGLRSGDVIVSVNDQNVRSGDELSDAISQMEPGEEVQLVVSRSGQESEVTARLGSERMFVWRGQSQSFAQQGQRQASQGQRQQQYWAGSYDEDIPPYAMQLEHDRRMAEQHERLERSLQELKEEVRELRSLLERR